MLCSVLRRGISLSRVWVHQIVLMAAHARGRGPGGLQGATGAQVCGRSNAAGFRSKGRIATDPNDDSIALAAGDPAGRRGAAGAG